MQNTQFQSILKNFSTYIFSRQLFNLLSKKLENEYEQLLWVTTTFLLSIKDRKKLRNFNSTPFLFGF
jgi:hypothetical protein